MQNPSHQCQCHRLKIHGMDLLYHLWLFVQIMPQLSTCPRALANLLLPTCNNRKCLCNPRCCGTLHSCSLALICLVSHSNMHRFSIIIVTLNEEHVTHCFANLSATRRKGARKGVPPPFHSLPFSCSTCLFFPKFLERGCIYCVACS